MLPLLKRVIVRCAKSEFPAQAARRFYINEICFHFFVRIAFLEMIWPKIGRALKNAAIILHLTPEKSKSSVDCLRQCEFQSNVHEKRRILVNQGRRQGSSIHGGELNTGSPGSTVLASHSTLKSFFAHNCNYTRSVSASLILRDVD